MKNNDTFTIIEDDGKEKVCNILFTFDSDETKKSYIVYTDNTKDKLGNIKVFASTFNPDEINNVEMQLEPIETDKEWRVIEKLLEGIQEELRNQSNGD